ncbi:MAG: MerR family transcriptional regulator [Lutibacter sp.]
MNNIKTEFTIKDLENFSGIKAHTIRIWEKRYNLFQPNRTDTNIRYYNLESLQKILNISLLNANGLKISKIAALSEKGLEQEVKDLIFKNGFDKQALNSLKLSMLNFDENLFNKTYVGLMQQFNFRTIFTKIFVPFLNEISILWQINTITPAHEHFITNLIKQKIHINIEKLQVSQIIDKSQKYVLYLPLNEIHELGLLYLHFELLFHGHTSIYLGQSVPVENLKDLQNVYNNICFVTYLTVEPSKNSVENYLEEVNLKVLQNTKDKLWVLGAKTASLDESFINTSQIEVFKSPLELLNIL